MSQYVSHFGFFLHAQEVVSVSFPGSLFMETRDKHQHNHVRLISEHCHSYVNGISFCFEILFLIHLTFLCRR